MTAYFIGDAIRLTGTFTDATGASVDPTTVDMKVKGPAGSYAFTGTQVTRLSAGVYFVDFAADVAGQHWYRIESTGLGQAAKEGVFTVLPSNT